MSEVKSYDNAKVEAFIRAWAAATTEAFQANERATAALLALDEMAGEPDKQTGTLVLEGTEHVAKIERKVNVTYPRPRGQEHPLKALMEKYPALVPLVKIEYDESGQKIAKLLADYKAGSLSQEALAMAAAVSAARQVKPGKPGIKVELRMVPMEGQTNDVPAPSQAIDCD